MAVLGDAYINVRIIGDPERQLKRKLRGMGKDGDAAGSDVAWNFRRGFKKSLGVKPFAGISDQLRSEAEQARLRLNQLIKTGYYLGPILTVVAGAIGALVTSLAALVSVFGAATPALMVFVNSLVAFGQAAIAVKLAMRGVAEAINIDVGEGPDLSGPLDRVLEARIRLRNIINKEQPERLAAAKERAIEAEERSADALRNSERALLTYNKAQERTAEAIEDLNNARDRAREKIKQLRFETEGAAISEKQARLAFERTRDALQRVQDLPPNSRARQEAELAFAEADLNLRRAIDSNATLKKEEEAATRAGVEGSDEVVGAKKAIEQATQAEADSQWNAVKAYRAAAKARIAADKAAEDASAGGTVQQQIDADISRARKQLQDALDALAKAGKGGGADRLQKALEDLSPAAREFVLYMREIKDEFKILGDSAATGFFPILTKSVELVRGRLGDLAPMFEETGKAAGNASLSIAEAFTEAQTFENIQKIFKNNNTLVEIFGRTIGNLVRAFSALLVAAGPLTEKFARFIETMTGDWAKKLNDDIDGQTEKFNRAGDIAADLGTMLRQVGGVFLDLGKVLMAPGGAGESLLKFFTEGSIGVREFLKAGGADGDGSLVTQFRKASDNGLFILKILKDILKIFVELGSTDNFTTFLGSLERSVATFGTIGTTIDEAIPAFGVFLEQFSIILFHLTESGGIHVFFTILATALREVNEILQNETVKNVFLFLAKVKGAFMAFGSIITVTKFIGKAFFGKLLLFMGKFGTFFGTWTAKLGVMMMKMGGRWESIGKILFKFGMNVRKFVARPFTMLFKGLKFLIKPLAVLIGWPAALIIAIIALGLVIYKFRDQILEFVQKGVESFMDFKDRVIGFFQELPEKIMDALMNLRDKILYVLGLILFAIPSLIIILYRLIRDNWDNIINWFKALPGRILDAIKGLSTRVVDFMKRNNPIKKLFDFVKENWPAIKQWFPNRIDDIVNFFKNMPDRIRTATRGLWDGLKDAFRTAINFIIDKWNDFKLELRIPDNVLTRAANIVGFGFTVETPNIPRLARGGVVMPRSGGTLGIIGEAGRPERIEPLDPSGLSQRDRAMITMLAQQSGMGATIHVHPSPGMNERELANLVSRRLAYDMRTGAA